MICWGEFWIIKMVRNGIRTRNVVGLEKRWSGILFGPTMWFGNPSGSTQWRRRCGSGKMEEKYQYWVDGIWKNMKNYEDNDLRTETNLDWRETWENRMSYRLFGKWKQILMKNNVPRNKKLFGLKIHNFVPFLKIKISQKYTSLSSRGELVINMQGCCITKTSKHFQMSIRGWFFKKNFERSLLAMLWLRVRFIR